MTRQSVTRQPLQTAVDLLWLGSWKAVMQDPKYKGKILL